jgi:hypothetical protein
LLLSTFRDVPVSRARAAKNSFTVASGHEATEHKLHHSIWLFTIDLIAQEIVSVCVVCVDIDITMPVCSLERMQ